MMNRTDPKRVRQKTFIAPADLTDEVVNEFRKNHTTISSNVNPIAYKDSEGKTKITIVTTVYYEE